MNVTPAELLRRICSEFPTVRVSESQGAEFVGARIEELGGESTPLREEWLSVFASAIEVVVTDDAKSDTRFLKLFVFEGRQPIVKFFNKRHERDSEDLLVSFRAMLAPVEPEIWSFNDPRPISRQVRPGIRLS